MQTKTFNFEVKRKMFHSCSIIVPIIYVYLPKIWMAVGLLIAACIVLLGDISRHYNPQIKELTGKFFTNFMRQEERNGSFNLSGASFMMVGFFLTVFLFSKNLAITALLILVISDCLAALVGIKIGTPIFSGKSLEGSAAFFLSSILISVLCCFFIGYYTNFFIIVISCLVTTIIEFYSKQLNINDNFLIPITYGLCINLLNFIINL